MITVENVQKMVARHYGLTLEDMKLMVRHHRVSHPRQVAMWLCRELTTNSLPRLGRFFGYRDHTTILHGCRAVDMRRAHDPELDVVIQKITEKLRRLDRLKRYMGRELTTEEVVKIRAERHGRRKRAALKRELQALERKRLAKAARSGDTATATIHGVTYKLIPYVGAEGRY